MTLTDAIILLEKRLEKQSIFTDDETIRQVTENSYGLSRKIIGIAYPQDLLEVQFLVNTANQHKIPLYPISRGQNIGYGYKLPPSDMQLIVDLHRMIKISNFDFPLTITLVSQERALNLNNALKSEFEKIGISPYRYGILDMSEVKYINQVKNHEIAHEGLQQPVLRYLSI